MLFEEPKHVRKLRTGHASNAHNLADLAVITTTRIHDLSDRVSTCPVRVFPILGLSSFAPQTAEKVCPPGRSIPGRFGTGGQRGWGLAREEEEEVWQHGQLARYKRPGGGERCRWRTMGNGQMGKKTARQRAGPETRTGIRRCRTGTGETGNGSDYSSYSPLPSLTGGL